MVLKTVTSMTRVLVKDVGVVVVLLKLITALVIVLVDLLVLVIEETDRVYFVA
jgi:hypothetical protein